MKQRGFKGKGSLRSQAGQAIIENILLMVVLIGVFSAFIRAVRGLEFATMFTEKPFAVLDGMIQCGVWRPCGMNNPRGDLHSNSASRVLSLDPREDF